MLLGYNATMGLKIVCIRKTSNPGEEGEYCTGAWQLQQELHTIFVRDGV